MAEAAKSNKFAFNKELVQQWVSQSPHEPLLDLISKNHAKFVEQHLGRIKALHTHAIDKLRDSEGKIQLSEGFEKNCGLKGSKLSGG